MGYYSLHISDDAERDIVNAAEYYSNINHDLAYSFLKEVDDIYDKLKKQPQFYSYISSVPSVKFRDVKLKSFPFLIIFEIRESDVYVSAVLHTKRKPPDYI